ncbi:signal transduction histidine kinase [Mucilaginibacter sp. SG538B]|uniref:tetratricopeptide repeat-containing sensor histidine kinase n=1 Tax=Mucilaginibacter sp. SG538B TaxID=2587021 RepID=UPI00159EAA21|nr:ATP-binding protein [Mucilaginibacter sp. SG538B]NVM67133.1 signal transduction histidine kinase [Mucilaginibacter sp. SG538B]
MKKNVSLLVLLLLAVSECFGQFKEVNKLKKNLPLIHDSIQYVNALNRLGLLLYEQNIDSAFFYAKKARNIAERLNYKAGKADALNAIGIVYDLKGNLQLSLRYYNEAYNLYKELKDTSNIVQGLMNIGLVFNETKENKKAIDFFKRAMNLGKTLHRDSIMSLVLCNYLLLYPEQVPKDSVEIYLKKAREIGTRFKDNRMLVEADQIQGLLYVQNNEREKGTALLQQAANNGLAMELSYLSLDIIINLGDLYMDNNIAKAIIYYKQGLSIAEKSGYHYYEKFFGKKLYEIYSAQNNLNEVQRYSEKLLKLYEDEEKFANTSGFDYIDYALKDQELEAITIRSQNRQVLAIVLGILFVITAITVIFTYRLYNLKKKHGQTLEELNRTVQLRNEKLEIDHEFNNRLVSILAHDFRQPIGALKTLATVLKDANTFTREELMELVDTMEHSSNISLEIFENILQWIKQQLSGFNYKAVPLPLKDLIDEAIQPFYLMGKDRGLKFVITVDPAIVIHADKELVQFIHRNFIHNAIKFSPDNSTITIGASSDNNDITVCVQDEGKGISPDKLKLLFNFKANMQYSNEKEKGAGVALMICKDFTEKMNGRIWVENNKEKGAIFCYSLPNIH